MIRGLAGWMICVATVWLTGCGGGPPARGTVAPTPTVSTLGPVPQVTVAPEAPADGTSVAAPAAVALSVQPTTVAVGDVAEAVLSIRDVIELYGAEVHLRFDPSMLEIVDEHGSADGVRMEAGGILKVGFTVINAVDNEAGSASYAVAQMPPSRAVTGSGDLVVFRVRTKAAGTTALSLESVILANAKGEAIPLAADVEGATLVIE